MKPIKIVVAGPVSAGKTTFVRSLSTTEVVNTDELSTEDLGKEQTTIAMDFGTLDLDGISVQLYGTPGQDRFDFMWEILSEGALGLILLVNGQRPGDFPQARNILEFITSRVPVPFIIGVTHQDLSPTWQPDEVADYFDLDHGQTVGVNATTATGAINALASLLQLIQAHEESSHGRLPV